MRISVFTDILVAATSYIAYTPSAGHRAVIKKIHWYNGTGGNGLLTIGFTTLAATWTPLLQYLMVNGVDGGAEESAIPLIGNSAQGFVADTTAGTGTTGAIVVRGAVGGVTPTCRVILEIEEDEL